MSKKFVLGDFFARLYLSHNRTVATNLSAITYTLDKDWRFKVPKAIISCIHKMNSGFYIKNNEITENEGHLIKEFFHEHNIKYRDYFPENDTLFAYINILNWKDEEHKQMIDTYLPKDRFNDNNKNKRIYVNQQEYLDLLELKKLFLNTDELPKHCIYCYQHTNNKERICDTCFQAAKDCDKCYIYTIGTKEGVERAVARPACKIHGENTF